MRATLKARSRVRMSDRSSGLTQGLRRKERTIKRSGALASNAEMMAFVSRCSASETSVAQGPTTTPVEVEQVMKLRGGVMDEWRGSATWLRRLRSSNSRLSFLMLRHGMNLVRGEEFLHGTVSSMKYGQL